MKTARILIAAGLGLTAWGALHAIAPREMQPRPTDVVAARQAAMSMSATSLNALKTASTSGVPVRNLAFAAGGLAKWGAALPAMFAPSTRLVQSRAKPEVWTDRTGFAAKAKEFGSATEALLAAARTDDKTAFDAALARTGAACKGCHDSYQVPPPAAKPG